MISKFIHTALLAVLALPGLRCQAPATPTPSYVYENEYGSIHILPKNKTHKRVIYSNNQGNRLDTLLQVNPNMNPVPADSGFPFLSLNKGGVEWHASYARIWEFSNLAFLGQFVPMEHMYERHFFRTGVPITVSGYISPGNGGPQIDGIYLNNYTANEFRFATVHGTVRKEPYPQAGDNKQAYRLLMEKYEVVPLTMQRMTGYTLTVNGQAHFVWDYAGSESYRLEGREPWTLAEEHKKITIEGILWQDQAGSVLKQWKIIE